MKSVRVHVGIEHRFIHEAHEAPVPLNAVAQVRAYQVLDSHPLPDTDLLASVWKVPEGAEMSLPDKCADKLVALGYAGPISSEAPVAPVPDADPAPAVVAEAAPVAAPVVEAAVPTWR